ncbi:hypothetical protein [Actinokineospora pegani]|uniref:hypothetical protein n=1 Tax=Actinokineospora pegani TaxID=2654637 RepID=UPI0012EAF5C2|nr:hypothetical protein [Actinokineospora pegani]
MANRKAIPIAVAAAVVGAVGFGLVFGAAGSGEDPGPAPDQAFAAAFTDALTRADRPWLTAHTCGGPVEDVTDDLLAFGGAYRPNGVMSAASALTFLVESERVDAEGDPQRWVTATARPTDDAWCVSEMRVISG